MCLPDREKTSSPCCWRGRPLFVYRFVIGEEIYLSRGAGSAHAGRTGGTLKPHDSRIPARASPSPMTVTGRARRTRMSIAESPRATAIAIAPVTAYEEAAAPKARRRLPGVLPPPGCHRDPRPGRGWQRLMSCLPAPWTPWLANVRRSDPHDAAMLSGEPHKNPTSRRPGPAPQVSHFSGGRSPLRPPDLRQGNSAPEPGRPGNAW
jgi:hypothetical protein